MGDDTPSSSDSRAVSYDGCAERSCRRGAGRGETRWGGQTPTRGRSHGHGIPGPAAPGWRNAVRVSWSAQEGGLSVSPLRKQVVRRTHRLRSLRSHGGIQSASREKVSPARPAQEIALLQPTICEDERDLADSAVQLLVPLPRGELRDTAPGNSFGPQSRACADMFWLRSGLSRRACAAAFTCFRARTLGFSSAGLESFMDDG